MKGYLDALAPVALNAWRVVLGFTFFTHGGQKLFGAFGGNQVETLLSQIGIAGILELFGGLAIIIGLRTREVALLLSGQMAYAYWFVHAAGGGLWPWANGGELAAVYCLSFLAMSTLGGGGLSMDGFMSARR